MFKNKADAGWQAIPLAVSLCALICATPALSQTADSAEAAPAKKEKRPAVSRAKPTSPNATINLVNMLVSQGVIKEEQAQLLIKQAEDEAYVSRQAAKDASAKADDAAKAATAAAAAAQPPGTRHVTYVPEVVKRQLRDEIKKEVMAKAEKENWASPGAYPEWAQRIRFYGDARVRYQGNFFPGGNDQLNPVNFNSINTGSPYDSSPLSQNPYYWPTYNTTQDRNQFRLRARLGMEADIFNGFTGGFRIATGENNSPVSTNQTMGNSGGNFSKYSLWLDRAYLKYQTFGDDLTLSAGRFDNPFWSPTDLVWYRELGFDGFAIQAKREVWEGITPFAVGGAFPIYNTDFNVGTNNAANNLANGYPTKLPSHDKWLFGGQIGVAAKISPEYAFRVGLAYYDFTNVQGQTSSPCYVTTAADVCDTDLTRPSFAQKGNSYIPLRNIVQVPLDSTGRLGPQFQYYGLASQFRPLVASAQLDLGHFHPYHIVIDGEYVVNTAFNRDYMSLNAINNRAALQPGQTGQGAFNGGNTGWMGRVTVGNKEIKHLWDWNVHAGYKYLESDATIDAFADSDFGLGGTNLKGYFLGGNLGLSENVWASLRWMSANNIAGIPYNVDVLQVDLNARF